MNSNKSGLDVTNHAKILWLCSLAGILFCASPAALANWEVSPELGAGVGYDSNARLSEVSGVTGNETYYGVDAQATFSYVTQLTDFELTPKVASKRFVDDSDLDSDDLFLRFALKQDRQKSNFRIRGDVSKESVRTAERLDVDFDIEDPEDIGRDDSGQVVGNGERDRIVLTPEFSYEFSPRYSLRVVGNYLDASYDETASQFLSDFQQYSVNASLLYDWSEKDTIWFSAVGSNFETDSIGEDSKSSQLAVGYSHAMSERTKLRFLVGGESTEDQDGRSETNPVGEVSIIHRYLSTTAIASYRRSVSGSGFGGQAVRDTVSLNLSRELTPKLALRAGVRAYTSDSLNGQDTDFVKRDYTQVRASASWHIRRTVWLDLDYRFTHIKRSQEGFEDNEDSNQVGLWIYWSPSPLSR